MKLKIAVYDDMPDSLNLTKQKIQNLSSEYEVDAYESGVELLENEKEYDVVFLDIKMPDMNGLKVADKLRKSGYKGLIIFLNGYSEDMPKAFYVKPFRYVTKPLEETKLEKSVTKVEKEIKEEELVPIKKDFLTYMIRRDDIIYLEYKRNNTYIKTIHEIIETKKPLKDWLKILGTKHFCQVHKSYIVPLFQVNKIEELSIHMKNTDEKIPISRLRKKKVEEAYFNYRIKHAEIIC